MRRATLLVLVVALAGCGGSGGGPSTVAWTPQPLPSPPPAARTCTAAVLRARPVLSAGTGGLVGEIRLRNVYGHPCSLSGTPTVKLRPALPQSVSTLTPAPSGLPLAWLRSVSGRRGAALPITLFNWCFPSKKPTLILTLPRGGGRLTVPLDASPRCIVAATPTTISLAPFRPAAVVARPWTRLDVSAELLPRELTVPAGGTLRYRAVLTNDSDDTLHLEPCPLVRQALAHVARIDLLACDEVPGLEPGKSVTFEMELPVPAGTKPGPDVLVWTADPYSTRPVEATARVTVQKTPAR